MNISESYIMKLKVYSPDKKTPTTHMDSAGSNTEASLPLLCLINDSSYQVLQYCKNEEGEYYWFNESSCQVIGGSKIKTWAEIQ